MSKREGRQMLSRIRMPAVLLVNLFTPCRPVNGLRPTRRTDTAENLHRTDRKFDVTGTGTGGATRSSGLDTDSASYIHLSLLILERKGSHPLQCR